MSSDDERPPVFDGPYGPVRDIDEPFEDAPSLVEILEDIKAKQEPKIIKGLLDPKQLHGEHYICLDAAHAESGRFRANHFIFLLTARHLDYEIAVHFKNVKKIEDSMAEKILTRFEIVDQSNKSKERPSICEESFVIDITAIESGLERKKLAGKGRNNSFEIPYNISDGATYNLTNNDNFCLFRAFEWLRMKHVLQHQRFSEYKRNERRQLSDITTLCRACGININLPFFSIEEYGEIIQAYYDRLHPGMYRLFCFGTFGKMKPLWKSEDIVYKQELCVLFTEGDAGQAGHYDPIKSTGRLFGAKTSYCFGTFESRECFEHHAKVIKATIKKGDKEVKIEKSVCKSTRKCVKCGIIYRAMLQDKERGHVCGHKFCRVCLGFHAPRECYIPYRPKKKTEKRIIFFDFECTTDFQPDPEIARFKHQVNFCYAHVTCTCCIEKGIWNQALQQRCGICGEYRTYAWAPFEFYNTEVERRFCVDDPLAAFTKWLLQFETETLGLDSNERGKKRKRTVKQNNNNGVACFLDNEAEDDENSDGNDVENNYMLGYDEGGEKPRSVTTYAYAHAGSRYDHVLIFGEMLRMGIRPELVRQGNHLLEMKAHKKGAITTTIFRDSYKLIPLKLASFVKTFGLNINGVENKKYFPHKFNKAARIKPNPGLRYIAKLCLNSLWGRFALRNRLTKTEIVDNNADLGKLLNDDKIELSSLDQLADRFWMVCYKTKDEHVVEHDTSNIVIALWTTSAARLHLLESMQQVYCTEDRVQRHDTQLAYTDTDSIFYAHCNDLSDPLPGGPQLGELTDEYLNDTIMEFICAGPKAYSLCLRNNVTGELKYKMKCRGITLDTNACARISHEKMKKMVLDNWGAADNNVVFDYETNFRITKNGEIFTVPIKKQFNPTVNKGVIRNHGLLIVPFGYSTGDYCADIITARDTVLLRKIAINKPQASELELSLCHQTNTHPLCNETTCQKKDNAARMDITHAMGTVVRRKLA
ncbi:hypothetical protein niasHT_030500 [Heterodera trifolii]|uniref:DNA-directed DNA polymerase n=1 Tax=Heterodera trifolii TaxID=157864 RepID=A0ABD2I0B4_9BILA